MDVVKYANIKIDNRQCEVLINVQNKMINRCYKHVNKYYKTQCEKCLTNNILILADDFHIKAHINNLVIEHIKSFVMFNY